MISICRAPDDQAKQFRKDIRLQRTKSSIDQCDELEFQFFLYVIG